MTIDRKTMAAQIVARLEDNAASLAKAWQDHAPINYFVIDDVLPEASAQEIRKAFPSAESMTFKESLRERKFVAAQMNKYNPLLEEAVYAFQAPEVLKAIEKITGLQELEADELLYAGGISLMAPGHFLNPHIDNSHDKFRQRYRIMNLLYYVSPDWDLLRGANLEVWPDGPKGQPVTLVSKFNRLIVMVTHRRSWHSVSENRSQEDRCCVSNYYFSKRPVGNADYFHVTSFRGRPEQPMRDMVLRGDAFARMMVRKLFPKGVKQTHHYYAKQG